LLSLIVCCTFIVRKLFLLFVMLASYCWQFLQYQS
jgi:hypothetical protein